MLKTTLFGITLVLFASAHARAQDDGTVVVDPFDGFGPTDSQGTPLFRLGYDSARLAVSAPTPHMFPRDAMTLEGLRVPSLLHADGISGIIAPVFLDATEVSMVQDGPMVRGLGPRADAHLRPITSNTRYEAGLGTGRLTAGAEHTGALPLRSAIRIDQRPFAPFAPDTGPQLAMADLGVQTELSLGERTTLGVFAFGAFDGFAEPSQQTDAQGTAERMSVGAMVHLQQSLSREVTHALVAGYVRDHNTLKEQGDEWSPRTQTLWLEDRWRWQSSELLSLTGGAALEHQAMTVDSTGEPNDETLAARRTEPLAWAQVEVGRLTRWYGYAGVRAVQLREDGRVGTYAGVSVAPSDRSRLALTGGVGDAGWDPTYELQPWGVERPDLEPQHTVDAALTATYLPASWLQVRGQLFGRAIRDQLSDVTYDWEAMVDVVDRDLYGAMAELRTNGEGPLEAWVDATRTYDLTSPFHRWTRTFWMTGNLRYTWGPLGVEGRVRYRDVDYRVPDDGFAPEPDTYVQLDARIDHTWEFGSRTQLVGYLEGHNLTGERPDDDLETLRDDGVVLPRTGLLGVTLAY